MKINMILFILATICSRIGSLFLSIYYNYAVVKSGYSISFLGTVTGLMYIPNFLLSFIAGRLADQHDNKKLLILFDFSSALSILTYYILAKKLSWYIEGDFMRIAILIAVLNSFAALYGPVSRTLVPKLIDKKHLFKFNSIYTTSSDIIKFVVPLVMSFPFILFLGMEHILLIDLLSFLLSMCCTLGMHIKDGYIYETPNKEIALNKEIYRMQYKKIMDLIVILFVINFSIAAFSIYLPFFAKQFTVEHYPRFVSVQSLGAFLTSLILIIRNNGKSSKKNIKKSSIVLAIIYALFPICTEIESVALVLTFIVGGCISYSIITFYSVVQTEVDIKCLGRILGTIAAITLLATPLGSWGMGVLVESVGIYAPILLLFFLIIALMFQKVIVMIRRKIKF